MSDWFAAQLEAAGMSAESAAHHAGSLLRCGESLIRGGAAPQRISYHWVPGRIEVFGKHTDYAGGRSLLCATEQGICAAAVARGDTRLSARDLVSGEERTARLDEESNAPAGDWATYVATVARRLGRDAPEVFTGVDVAFVSDIPRAAGLSSSSALVVALFSAMDAHASGAAPEWLRQLRADPLIAGHYLGALENGRPFANSPGAAGVGTLGGSQDHIAILCSRAGQLLQASYDPLAEEGVVSLPRNYVFAVAVSGVRAQKTGNAQESYNRMSLLASQLLACWREYSGSPASSLAAALNSDPAALEQLHRFIAGRSCHGGHAFTATQLRNRLDQFAAECNELIPAAATALKHGDLHAFGQTAARSHALADSLLGNQVDETNALVRAATDHGAAAASAFGAGFGGSVWALIERKDAVRFAARWHAEYVQRYPAHSHAAQVLLTEAGPPARQLRLVL